MACNKRIALKIVALLLFATGLFLLSISQIIYVEEKLVTSSASCEESFKVNILDALAGVCILMSFVANLGGSFLIGDSSQKLIFRRKIHDTITHSNNLALQDRSNCAGASMAKNGDEKSRHILNCRLCCLLLSLCALVIVSFIDVVPSKQASLECLFYFCLIVFIASLIVSLYLIWKRGERYE